MDLKTEKSLILNCIMLKRSICQKCISVIRVLIHPIAEIVIQKTRMKKVRDKSL